MIDIPNDVKRYMDISDKKPKIRDNAPEMIKNKAFEIDEKYFNLNFNLTGKHYFSEN